MTRARELANLGNSTTNLETLDTLYGDNVLTGRNLIINGAATVNQRGDSTGITSTGYYGPDRYQLTLSSLGTWSISQSSTAPSGFGNSYKLEATTNDASPAASDYALFLQKFEGQNLQQLKKGTASAESVTLSFWVRSSKTGTYIVELFDNDNSRSISASYTISAADTFEYKTLTFAGDTTGAFDDDNASSLEAIWWLAAGTDFTSGTLNTGWGTRTNANIAVGQANMADTANATWYITGVKLELGETATPFERKSYADYEWDCQRYYHMVKEGSGAYMQFCTGRAWGTGGANAPYKFPRVMRASPTMTAGGVAGDYDWALSAVPAAGSVTLNNDMMMINVSGSFTTGQIIGIGSNAGGSGSAALMFDAEL